MINFLHLSALLSLTLALCLQRNAKKMNGANISPSFYSFFIFFSIFVFILLLLPSFLSFFLSFFLSSFLPFFLPSFIHSFLSFLFYPFLLPVIFFFCLFFLSLSLFRFVFPCVPILIPPFLFLLFCSSFFCSSFFRRVRSTAKVPYRQRQASSQTLCPLSQSTISVRNLTRHASLCLLHCRLLCKL